MCPGKTCVCGRGGAARSRVGWMEGEDGTAGAVGDIGEDHGLGRDYLGDEVGGGR